MHEPTSPSTVFRGIDEPVDPHDHALDYTVRRRTDRRRSRTAGSWILIGVDVYVSITAAGIRMR